MSKFWTDDEINTLISLQTSYTWREIGEKLGRTAESCRLKFTRGLPLLAKSTSYSTFRGEGPEVCVKQPEGGFSASVESGPSSEKQETTVEADRERAGNDFWRQEYRSLETKYKKLLKERAVGDQLVDLAKTLAPQSYSPAPTVHSPNRKGGGGGKPQSAVLLLSDCHVGQVIEPDQTLGFGKYDFTTFLARLKYLEESVASILQDHTTTQIDELVVCLGGDLIDGALNHGAEAGQKNTLFSQFYGAGHAIAQFLRNLAPLAPKTRIYNTVGNHARWSHQHKMPTKNRYSNLDLFLAAYVEALTKDVPQIEWNLDSQPFTLFNVQGFKFHLSHGDHLRGGDKALGIPNHSVGRMISSTSQLFGKHDAPSPHYYLVGHLHRSIVLPHARGSVIINGGFAGMDGYGLANGFSPVDPSQVFFLVHPKYGKTATYDIWLRNAVLGASSYNVPIEFPIV